MSTYRILTGDCRETLKSLPDNSVQCCVTSPPYWGLRQYLPEGSENKSLELGLEPTPDEYVSAMVAVFREVKRVLRDDGTLWLNLGDSYATQNPVGRRDGEALREGRAIPEGSFDTVTRSDPRSHGLKPKDLVGIPWRVAFALQADGWYLRQDIVWSKGNPMPESVTDRCTRSHEYLFMLTKRASYFYDADAIREPHQSIVRPSFDGVKGALPKSAVPGRAQQSDRAGNSPGGRNRRSVWNLAIEGRPVARLRDDLTPEQRAYVVGKLTALGVL